MLDNFKSAIHFGLPHPVMNTTLVRAILESNGFTATHFLQNTETENSRNCWGKSSLTFVLDHNTTVQLTVTVRRFVQNAVFHFNFNWLINMCS